MHCVRAGRYEVRLLPRVGLLTTYYGYAVYGSTYYGYTYCYEVRLHATVRGPTYYGYADYGYTYAGSTYSCYYPYY